MQSVTQTGKPVKKATITKSNALIKSQFQCKINKNH